MPDCICTPRILLNGKVSHAPGCPAGDTPPGPYCPVTQGASVDCGNPANPCWFDKESACWKSDEEIENGAA